MSIKVSPPRRAVTFAELQSPRTLPVASDVESQNTAEASLDLMRLRKFRISQTFSPNVDSEIDEAAIALVELSVTVYGNLDRISEVATKLHKARFGV